ncbi:aspartic peptidase domain-containing protein [Penicillium chermesinum]|uniref:Aspartic peptidase domain-containing protein n=1 Tax=Penicillium chermesinum TaxID=63820 RepID=A0A9W9PKH6_9EURO|nr:aspartic peptidase domain-containing protein [Penicillium chermesinum]KAJ5249091.1 aspartic peptidase domain-containing protein [Penicillium chermesinum]KAJ6151194.1 aspartic peptidase domain-containing protein [Penicillium chermesinum]
MWLPITTPGYNGNSINEMTPPGSRSENFSQQSWQEKLDPRFHFCSFPLFAPTSLRVQDPDTLPCRSGLISVGGSEEPATVNGIIAINFLSTNIMKSRRSRALLGGLFFCLVRAETESYPLSLAADVDWYGIDGTWSAVNIYVGSELTTSSLFPSTVDRGTWLIGKKACENSSLSDCSTKRGGLYDPSSSSTWSTQDNPPNLGRTSAQATYGTDTILADYTEVPQNQLAVAENEDTWIGLLGLAVSLSDHALSDLTAYSLMEQAYFNGSISPSGTYGYTAGAHYRLKGVLASLTIGGVDQDRFINNSATFHLTDNLVPVVSLNTISISSASEDGESPFTPLQITASTPGTSSLYTLDSSTSYIWLPKDAFDTFGQAFNLTYDDNLGFYTYGNDTSLRQNLLAMDLSITFSISDFPDASQAVNITLPFQAFDHSLSYPFPNLPSEYSNSSLPYIPVKMASTSDEQRIGRVFFQEAYLAVDYEREQFSVYQAKFDDDLVDGSADIVRIESYDDPWDSSSEGQGMPARVKAGIGVGTAVGTLLAVAAGVSAWMYVRKRRSASDEKGKTLEDSTTSLESLSDGPGELDCEHENRLAIAPDRSDAVFELPGSEPPRAAPPGSASAELEAGPSAIRDLDHAAAKPSERRILRHSITQSSIAASFSSRITESSDEEDLLPRKGHTTSPPAYTASPAP